MARWRVANPELNLGELADRMKLSKSAVNHRLRRLQEMADGVSPVGGSQTADARATKRARRSA
jgi:DNA-binding transcriptional regulator WhiA